MSTQAALNLGLPPGLTFHPDDEELIEIFLLPSVRGEQARFPGVVIIEDDSAANTLPWKLLKRHGISDDDEAYFFVRAGKEAAAARQDRYCDGGGTWVSQRPIPRCSCICGEEIEWRKVNLNLHMGRGKSGSTGWVMHEYTLTEPPCPFLKICHIAFTGHGKDRKRVPDNESECQASKRARIEADANNNGSTDDEVYGTEYLTGDEEFDRQAEAFFQELVVLEKSIGRNREATEIQATVSDQDPCLAQASAYQSLPSDQGISSINQEPLDQDPCVADAYPAFPMDPGISPNNQQLLDQDHYVAQASAYQPLPTDQGISPINNQQLPELDQDPCAAQAYAYQPLPTVQGISLINQQWFLDLDQDPCVAQGSVYQPFPSDQGISPINQELPDSAYMPMTYQEIQDARLQPLQSPSAWSFS